MVSHLVTLADVLQCNYFWNRNAIVDINIDQLSHLEQIYGVLG